VGRVLISGRCKPLHDGTLSLRIKIMAILLILTGSSSATDPPDRDYLVKYLQGTLARERAIDGLGKIKVMAYNTRTGDRSRVDEFSYDKVHHQWCDDWYLQLDNRPPNAARSQSADFLTSIIVTRVRLGIDWAQVAGIKEIISDLSTPGVDLEIIAGSYGACHPPSGRMAISGAVVDNSSGSHRPVAVFLGVLESSTGEVLIMREEVSDTSDEGYSNYYRPFFDSEGKHLYYKLGGHAKRLSIETQALETISAGDNPVVPWNIPIVIVHSSSDGQYKLLDEDLNVLSTIDSELEGTVLSAFAIDLHTCLVATSYVYSPESSFGMAPTTRAAILELDFERGTVREIVNQLSPLMQILDAQAVE
jgi:hypothetical protein